MKRDAPSMYGRAVPLDPAVHRTRKLSPLVDFSVTERLHAVYLTATEFAQAALEFPIVFVETSVRDDEGRPALSPVALLGLSHGENLHVEGGRWQARYIPAFIRRYPFLTAKVPGSSETHVLVDDTWGGFSEHAGEPLFGDGDRPTSTLQRSMDFLERFELESERTRVFCERVASLGVLKEMKADATLPNGQQLSVDGFHAIDEDKLHALPDAVAIALWRGNMLMLMQAHLMSLANIRHLVGRKAVRLQSADRAVDLQTPAAALRSNRK